MKILQRAAALFLTLLMLCQLFPVAALATGSAEYQAPSAFHSVTFGDKTYLVEDGYTISEFPEPPVEEGRAFLGWYDGDTLVTAPFTPTKDVRLTAKFEEINLSEQTLVASADDGSLISLTGVLPEGCVLTVTDEAESPYQRLLMKSRGGPDLSEMKLYTYNIQLTSAAGQEYQPETGPVTVTVQGRKFTDALATGRSIRLVHEVDENNKEEITGLQVSGNTVSFQVSHFSRFIFTGVYDLVDWGSSLATDSGVGVSLSGVMPNGATAAALSAAPAVEEGAVLAAADITLYNSDVKVQPSAWGGELTVTLTSQAIADAFVERDELHVVHIADDGTRTLLDDSLLSITGNSVTFPANQFSVYAVIGNEEPTARMKVTFHAYDDQGNPKDTVMYVKENDTSEALEMILYDPGVGKLDEGETFRGWTQNENYSVAMATSIYNKDSNPSGAMTIQDIRKWAEDIQEARIVENPMPEYHFYPMILKNFEVRYLDRFGVAIDTDSAYMLRGDTAAQYTVNMNYETNDEDYHFKGWVTNDKNNISTTASLDEVIVNVQGYDDDPYKLYKNNTSVSIDGNVTFMAHAPKGKWLIFHEVMKGATYTAPQFLEENEQPQMPDPSRMLLLGYEFDGWYKTYTETKDPVTGEVTSRTYSDPFTPGPINEKTNIYAKWKPAEWAPYTVIIWKKDLDGQYAYAESVELAGPVGSTITTTGTNSINQNQTGNYVLSIVNNNDADYLAVNGRDINNNEVTTNFRARHLGRTGTTHNYENPDYIGFNCVKIDQNVKINPEGTSVVNVYYDRIEYTIKIYHARSTGSGNNIAYQVATTRTGNGDPNPLGPAAGSANYGMNWTGNIQYHQNSNGTWSNGYSYLGPVPYPETSGNYTYYYTTITAEYGADISDSWPKYSYFPDLATGNTGNNNNTYGFVSWYMMSDAAGYQGSGSGLNTFKGIISKMDEKLLGDITSSTGNLLFGRYDARELYYYTYQIWFEQLEGEDYSAYPAHDVTGADGKKYYLADSFVANSAASDPKKATQAPTYAGYVNVRSVQPDPVNHQSTCEFYYHRVQNPIVYRDGAYFDGNGNRLNAYPPLGTDVESSPIPFETDISSYGGRIEPISGQLIAGENYKLDYPPSYPGFVFEGWYTDSSCTTPYDFNIVMPDTSITVYAKFRQVQYRVFLHPNVPEDKVVYWGSNTQEMNFRASYGTNISLPTGILIQDDDHTDILDESYEFSGWYRDDGTFRSPFDGDAYVLTDDLAVPYDKNRDMTDTMDKYGNIIDPPGSNSDIIGNKIDEHTYGNRWWITKKIDLYGKWIKKLDEGTGIQVIYDPNGGSGEVKDETKYKDGTSAVAQSAPVTPPKTTITHSDGTEEEVDKVFLYWVLQRWDSTENKFVDVAPLKFVYPGDLFDISFNDARTVVTTETDPETGEETTKTEYFLQLRAEYTDPEREMPTHIWWYSNFGNNDVVKWNRTDASEHVEDIGINEAAYIKPENTFVRPGYEFLGWARVESTDPETGEPVEGHPALHPELDEDDLFLKYVKATDSVPAHFEAQDQDGNWVTVTQVAADEYNPYHDLYAVWKPLYIELNVEKKVSGNMADITKGFSFTATLSGTDKFVAEGEIYDGQSSVTFQLSHNGSFKLKGVPVTAEITVTEDPDGYTPSITSTTTSGTAGSSNTSYSLTAAAADDGKTITFTNDKTITVDTGIRFDTIPYLLILALCALGLEALRRRRVKGGM